MKNFQVIAAVETVRRDDTPVDLLGHQAGIQSKTMLEPPGRFAEAMA